MIAELEDLKKMLSIRYCFANNLPMYQRLIVYAAFVLYAMFFLNGICLLNFNKGVMDHLLLEELGLRFSFAALFFISGVLTGKTFIAEAIRTKYPDVKLSAITWSEKDVEKCFRKDLRKFIIYMGWNEQQQAEARASISIKKQKQIDELNKAFQCSSPLINSIISFSIFRILIGLTVNEIKKSASFFLCDITELENLEHLFNSLPLTSHVDSN